MDRRTPLRASGDLPHHRISVLSGLSPVLHHGHRAHHDHAVTSQWMMMKRPRRLIIASSVLVALLLALALEPGAAACVIDNTASLSANGVRATPTTAAPSGPGPWAQFTVGKAFASGAPVQFAELHSDLVRSLAPATLAAPFRWAF